MRGKAIWTLGFLTVFAGLNAITAIVLALNLGIDATFRPWLFDSITGAVPVYVYLIASVLGTLAFLGGTSHRLMSELSYKDVLNEINMKATNLENGQSAQQKLLESMQARVFLVDEGVNSMRKDVAKAFGKQAEELKQVHADMVKRINGEVATVRGEMARQFTKQEADLKEARADLARLFDAKLTDVRDGLARQLADVESTLTRHELSNRKIEKSILNQEQEIANIKLALGELEEAFVTPKPELTSESRPEDVRGIGENTGNDLRQMGVTNVGELLMTEPAIIAEKTGMSEKVVEKLQGRAQLAMVPGVKERDLVLLEEVGVTNRKELAEQDPLDLGRRLSTVFAACVEKGKIPPGEKPKIEEIHSWVKLAKS